MRMYKSLRIVNGKPKWIITDENFNIIRGHTKEQLKLAILGDPPKKCCMCGSTGTYTDTYGRSFWRSHKCDNENCTKNICNSCYMDSPDSILSLIKSMRKRNSKNLRLNDNNGLGQIGECTAANILNIYDCDDCDVINNIYNLPYDIYVLKDNIYGTIDVKTASLSDGSWYFNSRRKVGCNYYFCLGFSSDLENIEKVYIIPNKGNIQNLIGIRITKNSSRRSPYREFEISSKNYNDAYHYILSRLKDCPVLRY